MPKTRSEKSRREKKFVHVATIDRIVAGSLVLTYLDLRLSDVERLTVCQQRFNAIEIDGMTYKVAHVNLALSRRRDDGSRGLLGRLCRLGVLLHTSNRRGRSSGLGAVGGAAYRARRATVSSTAALDDLVKGLVKLVGHGDGLE